jgi:hypothetical protein
MVDRACRAVPRLPAARAARKRPQRAIRRKSNAPQQTRHPRRPLWFSSSHDLSALNASSTDRFAHSCSGPCYPASRNRGHQPSENIGRRLSLMSACRPCGVPMVFRSSQRMAVDLVGLSESSLRSCVPGSSTRYPKFPARAGRSARRNFHHRGRTRRSGQKSIRTIPAPTRRRRR